jgi:hypothetical protein
MSRRKPALVEGHSLIEIRVRRRKAIDVPATLDRIGGLPVVGRAHDFVGLDLLLPEGDLEHASVSKIWRHTGGARPVVERPSPADHDLRVMIGGSGRPTPHDRGS